MLHIYSGNGKGKTTAGFGLVLRQAGYERRVAVAAQAGSCVLCRLYPV